MLQAGHISHDKLPIRPQKSGYPFQDTRLHSLRMESLPSLQTGAPLHITDIVWRHADETLPTESPDSAGEGEVVTLEATFENYVEDAGVDFFVRGTINRVKKELEKAPTRCQNSKAAVQWPCLSHHFIPKESKS